MAVFNVKSTLLSNRDAVPKILTDAYVSGGEICESEGFCATGSAADAVGSTYRLNSIPSNSRMTSLILQCQALGAGGKVDVGVYYPTFIPKGAGLEAIVPSSVINASYFATAVDVSAALGPTEIINESGSNSIANQELPLWSALGLAADPGIELDIVATVQTILAAAGNIGLKSRYIKQ